ncbi:MAG: transcription-repair coupling factor, partial [Chthoniobacterales bacterium]
DYSDFEPGDLVVHLDHGIGKFLGLETLDPQPSRSDLSNSQLSTPNSQPAPTAESALAIEFANSSKLYVPLDQAWQVSRYVGLGKRNPALSTLGDGKWQRAVKKAERSIFEYAATMLRLQAERDTSVGYAYGPDTHWQHEFESSFLFTPTADQARAIEETKSDMESSRPTDRLICGDVGFGKTEVAIRAVFKAVMGGKQAALLAPTTVLAQQHAQTLRERMSDYPVTVESLHRFRTKAEQTATVRGLLAGSVDVVVGTHRLLSNDVKFKNLGLVVVDEEQRFGVKHKEILKDRFRLIDVLTLSATPIPRTLYLALMGARDMSLIETPPLNRQPVDTTICAYDERTMRDAIVRELKRGGQTYLLHNRVRTIDKLAARIKELVPDATVAVGHGQMGEHELEPIMRSFVAGDIDVLVSTTIIESGLDIPNANTIIIDRADRFGLADLYQLRGRVGRSHHKAYAYLMLPRELMTASGDARKRVQAIQQYSELGAGFKIAMRDLEIRGAGNILGTAQSGHILNVGFDLYCKMLKRSVATLQGQRVGAANLATARLDFLVTSEPEFIAHPDSQLSTPNSQLTPLPAFIPTRYVTDARARIEAYRKLADVADRPAIESLRAEFADRYGPPPPAV